MILSDHRGAIASGTRRPRSRASQPAMTPRSSLAAKASLYDEHATGAVAHLVGINGLNDLGDVQLDNYGLVVGGIRASVFHSFCGYAPESPFRSAPPDGA